MMLSNEQSKLLENLAYQSARWTGSSTAFLTAIGLTLLWALTGPFFHFDAVWELAMNTVSSVVTFIMVFLLQRSQNKDSLAMQIKLNEIIAALHGANNRLISVEDLSEEEMLQLRKNYQTMATHIQNSDESSTHAMSTEKVINEQRELAEG